MDDAEEKWVSIGQAARMLGIGRPAIYGRIKRGTLQARRSNEDRAWQVVIDPETVAATEAVRERDSSRGDDVTDLRIENGRLEERLAAVERELTDKVVRLERTEAELAVTREKLIAEMGRSIWSRLFGQ